jgi:hypothetical protein
VLSVAGRVLAEGRIVDGSGILDVTPLAAGLYQLEIRSAAGRIVHKFSKER